MSELILKKLKESLDSKNPDEIEYAINDAWQDGMNETYVDVLIEMLALTWHYRHEDIVNALQELKSPKSVSALFEAATVHHPYLEFDENYSLARKCTWALADIGSSEAKEKLELLAKDENKMISSYALKRLENWENELKRKGT